MVPSRFLHDMHNKDFLLTGGMYQKSIFCSVFGKPLYNIFLRNIKISLQTKYKSKEVFISKIAG